MCWFRDGNELLMTRTLQRLTDGDDIMAWRSEIDPGFIAHMAFCCRLSI